MFATLLIATAAFASPCAVEFNIHGATCCKTCSESFYMVPGLCGICLTQSECHLILGEVNVWHRLCMSSAADRLVTTLNPDTDETKFNPAYYTNFNDDYYDEFNLLS